jgi:hypothetical protein
VIDADDQPGALGGGHVLGKIDVRDGVGSTGADEGEAFVGVVGGGEVHRPLKLGDVHPLDAGVEQPAFERLDETSDEARTGVRVGM